MRKWHVKFSKFNTMYHKENTIIKKTISNYLHYLLTASQMIHPHKS